MDLQCIWKFTSITSLCMHTFIYSFNKI